MNESDKSSFVMSRQTVSQPDEENGKFSSPEVMQSNELLVRENDEMESSAAHDSETTMMINDVI